MRRTTPQPDRNELSGKDGKLCLETEVSYEIVVCCEDVKTKEYGK